MLARRRKHKRIEVERMAELGIARPVVPGALLMPVYLPNGWIGRIEGHAHA